MDIFYALRLSTMPATPLHCSIAYLIKRWKPQLSLPALLVGTILPDLEIPFTYLMTDDDYHRLFLHSFLGAATVGTFLSVSLTVFLYPSVVSFFFKLGKEKIGEECRFCARARHPSRIMLCRNSLHHEFNPVLYPFVNDSFDALILMNDWTIATAIVTSVLLALFIFFVVDEIKREPKTFGCGCLSDRAYDYNAKCKNPVKDFERCIEESIARNLLFTPPPPIRFTAFQSHFPI